MIYLAIFCVFYGLFPHMVPVWIGGPLVIITAVGLLFSWLGDWLRRTGHDAYMAQSDLEREQGRAVTRYILENQGPPVPPGGGDRDYYMAPPTPAALAAVAAWDNPGPQPDYHRQMQGVVTETMPTLANQLNWYISDPNVLRLIWTTRGAYPKHHRKAQKRIRDAMPLLGRALDRLAADPGYPWSDAAQIRPADGFRPRPNTPTTQPHHVDLWA